MSDPNLFFGQPADGFHLRLEARDIMIGAPDGRGYELVLREYAEVHDAAMKFAKSVCDMFETDNNWSVYDVEGADEFFARIGFVPPQAAVTVGDDEPQEIVCSRCADITDDKRSPDGERCPDCHDRAQYGDEE